MTQYCLYWIRKETHNNPFEEGYIGITKNFERRMWDHKAKAKTLDNTLQRAIRKYGWESLCKEVLLIGSKEYCQELEKNLRPKEYIGWNVCIGGFLPKSPSEEARRATSLRCKGKPGTPHTQEFKDNLRLRNMRYTYTITHPDGRVETSTCLKDWCEKNGIRQNCMQRVAAGKRKHHKGYRCTRVAN